MPLVPERRFFFLLFLLIPVLLLPAAGVVRGQEYDPDERETDPLVGQKLEQWQDWKFGFMMHWGPYSQWGVVESWTLCSEDRSWIRRHIRDYCEYTREYERLQTTFDPVRFDPDAWAEAAAYAGMRYVVFTTKHHDGFCMFDSALTDYDITDPATPFSRRPRANVTREIFTAFRARGFGTGAYFSKADWHCEDYWAPEWATPDRNVNYSIERYPERWQRFCDFTYGQIEELMTGYGPVDILWLDGGWVRPIETLTGESRDWAGRQPQDQDIDMPRIAAMARRHQPGLIVVDRTVHGRYENYRTPEQQVPAEAPPYVWETCMTMANQWSYNADDTYKPTRQLIHLLIDIVAKGGNLLLNVGPSPEGELPPTALERLREIGDWMQVNSPAIYGTRAVPPYKEGNVCFTRLPGERVHAIYLAAEGEEAPPEEIRFSALRPEPGSEVRMLGVDRPLRWRLEGAAPGGEGSGGGAGGGGGNDGEVVVTVPRAVRSSPPCAHAWTLVFVPAGMTGDALRPSTGPGYDEPAHRTAPGGRIDRRRIP